MGEGTRGEHCTKFVPRSLPQKLMKNGKNKDRSKINRQNELLKKELHPLQISKIV